MKNDSPTTVHVPILVRPIVQALIAPLLKLPPDSPPHWIVDCTLGGGGHTQALLNAVKEDSRLRQHRILSLDRDPAAVARARERFQEELAEDRLEIQHRRFSNAEEPLQERKVLGLLADLGFSSDQMDTSDRGFSFHSAGPLDMRMDPSQGQSCRDYLLEVSERELEEVLREYGEERFSKRIAGAIIQARREKRLPGTTKELSDLVVKAIPVSARHGRIHAATRSFQALRIVVNEELKELDCLLERVILSVQPGGRVAILSFHSLEDRKVKHVFKGKDTPFEPLTKKPIEADEEELRRNPRARSAKLRVAERR